MTYYWAGEDEAQGVLCVDQLDSDYEVEVANLAELYPNTIYFEYTKPVEFYYFGFEGGIYGVGCLSPQGWSEGRVAEFAERNPNVIFFAVEVPS